MNWDDFKNSATISNYLREIETDIKCPTCGKNIYMRTDVVLTTCPEQYCYFCKCGWDGTSFRKWTGVSPV